MWITKIFKENSHSYGPWYIAKNTDFFEKMQIFHRNIDISKQTKEEKLKIITFDTYYTKFQFKKTELLPLKMQNIPIFREKIQISHKNFGISIYTKEEKLKIIVICSSYVNFTKIKWKVTELWTVEYCEKTNFLMIFWKIENIS